MNLAPLHKSQKISIIISVALILGIVLPAAGEIAEACTRGRGRTINCTIDYIDFIGYTVLYSSPIWLFWSIVWIWGWEFMVTLARKTRPLGLLKTTITKSIMTTKKIAWTAFLLLIAVIGIVSVSVLSDMAARDRAFSLIQSKDRPSLDEIFRQTAHSPPQSMIDKKCTKADLSMVNASQPFSIDASLDPPCALHFDNGNISAFPLKIDRATALKIMVEHAIEK